jgi:hypothetical protein
MTKAASPGTQLWVKRYDSLAAGDDEATSVAVSPSGGTAFVTGSSQSATSGLDYATVAYSAATGARLWVSRYNGPGNGDDKATSLAVSPDGNTVYVTGSSQGTTSGLDYATVAYRAATGAQLWVSRYNGPANLDDAAASLAVSPGGGSVFVTGYSKRGSINDDSATVAFDAATGAQLWVSRYSGSPRSDSSTIGVRVSPDGSTAFVTGTSCSDAKTCYATIAYSAATGATLWVRQYVGSSAGSERSASSLAVSPGGGAVFVTGFTHTVLSGLDYTTVAYNATTGATLWARRYNGPANVTDIAWSVAVSPDAGTVFVTGNSIGKPSGADIATVAYNAVTGATRWVRRYKSASSGSASSGDAIAFSPGGGTVYVTGYTEVSVVNNSPQVYVTVAYDTATGSPLWVKRYDGPGKAINHAVSMAVSSSTGSVFITGTSDGGPVSGFDYATIGYAGSLG